MAAVISNAFSLIQSPFQRLRDLLGDIPPGAAPIDLTIGEPRHGVPTFVSTILAEHAADFGKYPPIAGATALREAIAAWLRNRYDLPQHGFMSAPDILPVCGTREGLVSALVTAKALKPKTKPIVLMPNPFYQAYYAAAVAAECEPVLLSAGPDTYFLPNIEDLSASILNRTVAFYFASPANPQGAIASSAYLKRLIDCSRKHSFYLFSDECYSEIYMAEPPPSALQVAAQTGSLDHVLIFNSLSKRSNVPGLRSGFIAGDAAFLKSYFQFRNVAAPQVPLPIQYASAALWSDETHVEASRALYREKLILAQNKLGHLSGFRLPEGGFFLWLNVSHLGGSETAAKTIWKGCGVKILPGAYLAIPDAKGCNPAHEYARLALVDPIDITGTALDRLAAMLS